MVGKLPNLYGITTYIYMRTGAAYTYKMVQYIKTRISTVYIPVAYMTYLCNLQVVITSSILQYPLQIVWELLNQSSLFNNMVTYSFDKYLYICNNIGICM